MMVVDGDSKNIAGGGEKNLHIVVYAFVDGYEQDFLARMVTRAFHSRGLLYGG